MSGLFGMLSTTAKALDAQRYGLDVAGQNIANVNTPGYSRRVVDLGAVPPTDQRLNAGGGVEILGIRRLRDRLFDRRLFDEQPEQHRQQAIADSLSLVEVGLGPPEASINPRLTAFFDAWTDLADAPTSSAARSAVVAEGQSLAAAFRMTGDRLTAATQDVDARVRAGIDEVNSLAQRLASLNDRIANADASGTLTLRDEQAEVIGKLSELLDVEVIEHADGTAQVTYGCGRPLVIGRTAYPLAVQSAPVTGLAQIYSDVSNTTSEITGGRIAGLLQTRDTLIPGFRTRLDDLAYQVVQEVNTRHDAGFTLAGVDAPAFFQPLASATGAGEARSFALSEAGTHGEVVRQIQNLRDSVSGVSLDEEAAAMMRFQRAYEASARFFTTVNQTLDTLLNLGR